MTQKKQEPSSYANASFMDDPALKEEGKKWVRLYGCAGCHEISGMEDEGRIGTELTYEGSKPIERLDFALFTEVAQRGGKGADQGPEDLRACPKVRQKNRGTTTRDFSSTNSLSPNIYDQGKVKSETEALRMPNLHLTKDQVLDLTRSCSAARRLPCPPSYQYKPGMRGTIFRKAGGSSRSTTAWDATSSFPGSDHPDGMKQYQDRCKEQLPPKLLTEGARVDPEWLRSFLSNPALSTTDTNRNGVRPYLKVRMPTFSFSDNELRKLVRFFQALSQQPHSLHS